LKQIFRRLSAFVLACMLAVSIACAEVKPSNPLLGGLEMKKHTKTSDKFVNILLLGIDYGYEYGNHVSFKDQLEDCHTDAIVVASINKTKRTVDLISLPRDTLSYVPGVKGIYKLNAAINCAPDIKKGIEKTRETVSWHLGGIEIHHYIAVDVPALVALGNAIGGVEFDLEMSYTGSGGHYEKGLQVLDGQGMMDYVRARKNAPVGGTDLGRTQRQRKMLSAIFQKLKSNPGLAFNCVKVLFSKEVNIFTDIGFFSAIGLLPAALKADLSSMETHVLDGKLQDFYSNFNFTDQEARREMLLEVYGIEAEESPFVSSRYTRWLLNEGFESAKCINLAQKVLSNTKAGFRLTKEQKAAKASLEAACETAAAAFDAAALHQGGDERDALLRARNALKKELEASAELLGYTEKLRFKLADTWYEDALINEYQFNWN